MNSDEEDSNYKYYYSQPSSNCYDQNNDKIELLTNATIAMLKDQIPRGISLKIKRPYEKNLFSDQQQD